MRCTACECSKTASAVVFGSGSTKTNNIMSVGEGPGPDEDKEGVPFIGNAGQVYDQLLDEAGIDRKKIWTDNIVKCFPGRNTKGGFNKPSIEAVTICTELWLFKQIKVMQPRVILAWGLTAAAALLKTTQSMGDLVGKEFETEWGIVIPLYHPSYFLRNSGDHVGYGKVLTALQRAAVLVGMSSSGTFVDQVKVEHHQEDKRVIAALEAKSGVFTLNPWRDDREYTQAWTDGTAICLIYKTDEAKKKAEVIRDFEWYFYLRTTDVMERIPRECWSYWFTDGLVHRLQADPVNPAWTMVYTDRHVVRTTALKEHLLESYLTLWNDHVVKKYKEDVRLRKFLDEIESYGVQHYEADLTPTRRFMTDYDIKIQSAYDEMYMDIETDDTEPLGDRKMLGERRILSIAWEILWTDKRRKPSTGFLLVTKESDRAEKEMLEEFVKEMEKIDIMYAWNGNNFDFPIMRHRMRRYRIQGPWEVIHTIDLLRTWIRYFQRGASVNTSYSLQNIAMHVLKRGKIDWKLRAKERGLKIHSFLELYRQAPDILEEYNRDDCHKLVELEQFTGFAKIDQVFSRIGNCFARDYHITTKIDSLLLKRGKQVGIHFKTKKIKIMAEGGKAAYKKSLYADGDVYEGAYVLEPNVGMHDDVAAVDFKGLYPSVMVAWNISPETYISDEQATRMDPSDYTTCPTGTKFLTWRKGFVPEIFADTGEKRKVYQDLQKKEEVGSDRFLLFYRLAYSFKRLGLSFYGDLGNVESRYFHPKVAEAVTLSGQYVLKAAIEFAHREGIEPLYGDSVAPESRIYVDAREWTIEDFWQHVSALPVTQWNQKESIDLREIGFRVRAGVLRPGRWGAPRMHQINASLNRIIRHRTNKRMFEITTMRGKTIRVTEDHSLVIKRGSEYCNVSPLELKSDDIIYIYKRGSGPRGGWKGARKVFKEFREGPNISSVIAKKRGFKIALALKTFNRKHPEHGHLNRLKQVLPTEKTKPERQLAAILRSLGIGFKCQSLISDGSFGCHPDFVFSKEKVVIFVDGDYWHGNPLLYKSTELNTTQQHTRQVDAIQRKWLTKQGWQVKSLWASALDPVTPTLIRRLRRWLGC